MSQAEDKMINELVTELLDEVKTSDKEPIQEQKKSESSSGTTPSIPTESSGGTTPSAMPPIDLSQANKLFSGLIKSFIPPELKKNKDVQKMFDMFFADTNTKKDTKNTVTEEKKDLQDDDVQDENEEDVEDGNEDVEDVDDEQDVDTVEDVYGENAKDNVEKDEENAEDNEDDCDCDCNNCEMDNCDDCVYESKKYAFVIMWDDKPIAFTKTFTNAQKYMNKLYRNLVMKHANVFTKTVRELGSIRVYERKVYTLFPFQDTLMAHFSIKQIPNVE